MRVAFVGLWMASGAAGAALDAEYGRDIRPMLAQYCLGCHSAAKRAGELDLERFASYSDVMRDPGPWRKAVEQLGLGEMPPKGMPPLPPASKTRLLAWIRAALGEAARARAGDPGPVVLRRLNNAEYGYTVRDLTGVDSLDPVREFPADGAAGEGFMNTGQSLAMSPALLSKYLDAGKSVAAHAVLLPAGIRFSKSTSRSDQTNEILAEIRAFYAAHTEQGGADTVTQQGIALDKNRGGTLPLDKYLKASLELRGGAPKARIDAVARRHSLSPKYLGALTALLSGARPSPLLDRLRARWRTARPADAASLANDIAAWRETLWKFSSVGHIGKVDGPKAWMEPVSPIVEEQEFRVKPTASVGASTVPVYLAAYDAGDGPANDAVVWREPRLLIPGRAPVLTRDLPALVEALSALRTAVLAATARSLGGGEPDPAWTAFVGGVAAGPRLDLLARKIEKSGAHEFVQGWGSAQTPMLLANASDQTVRVPGTMKPRGVAMHPSVTLHAAAGWRSPVEAAVRIDGEVQRAHPECGNGVTWSVELRRGVARLRLAGGELRGAAAVAFGPLERVRVLPGDLVSVLIGPREANHSCDLTAVALRISGGGSEWSLAGDVAPSVLAGNPHADGAGHPVWHFYSEPVVDDGARGTFVPSGSLLARWMTASSPDERRELATQLQALLAGPAPGAESPDAALHRLLASLASPLLAGVTVPPAVTSPDIRVQAPSVHEIRLPADLAAVAEFVTTGALDPVRGAEGTVQLEVATLKPTRPLTGLIAPGTTIGDKKGTWSSNNQTVAHAMPVLARQGSAARRRVEAWFDEFRQMFPASLCYTKIVPVDEVVTLTLYHREDEHLSRLLLDADQKARLDRLWDELHYVSRDGLALVDAFEQLWQYATQDADPSKFEPLRQPIAARAAAFRRLLLDSEPRHVDAVIEFAGRAYRRPLTGADGAQLRTLYQQLRGRDLPHDDAIRLMLARVLVSPAFLYRAESAPPGKSAAPVGDYAFASRLSYFLWSSRPDDALLAAAASGKLRDPAVLRAQVRRMLRDPRARRLATEFGAAWLHIHGFDTFDEKSERHFPEFRALRGDMYEESIRFLTGLFAEGRSVLSLIDSDYTFLNERLARHYGIPGVRGEEWRRVDGVKQYGRGGVLGQASVLAKQAGASRTSPILRGNWISEVLLGDKLPRPPKDVPQLPADESAETLTVRQMTERHTRDARCAGCHARVDPYGFTLERFDAVGRWRERDAGNRTIDDRAVLRDGTPVAGAAGLRAYLLGPARATFVRQFCRKLLGYALGRAVELSDEPLLDAMAAALAANGYDANTAVDLIVASRQFQYIRGRDHDEPRLP